MYCIGQVPPYIWFAPGAPSGREDLCCIQYLSSKSCAPSVLGLRGRDDTLDESIRGSNEAPDESSCDDAINVSTHHGKPKSDA